MRLCVRDRNNGDRLDQKMDDLVDLADRRQEDNSLSQIAIKMHFLFLERHDANLSAIARALLRCR
jgi:hypothetical protein